MLPLVLPFVLAPKLKLHIDDSDDGRSNTLLQNLEQRWELFLRWLLLSEFG